MRNPYLVGTKIYLRPLEEDDAAVCHPWLNDPEVWRTLTVRGRPNTEARSREYIRALDQTPDQVLAIVTREDEQSRRQLRAARDRRRRSACHARHRVRPQEMLGTRL